MDRPKGSSVSNLGTTSSHQQHRASILSRSRTSKKIISATSTSTNSNQISNSSSSSLSLKRSKSLHCPKATRFTTAATTSFNALMNNSGGGDGGFYQQKQQYHPLIRSGTQGELPQRQHQQQHYGSRRHHSTNDYEQMMVYQQQTAGKSNNGSFVPNGQLVLNSSSHSLYRLYNSPSTTSVGAGTSSSSGTHYHPVQNPLYQPRASCASSGASLASLNSENHHHQQNQQNVHSSSVNGSRKASECFYEEEVFEPLTDFSQLLSQQMNSLAIFGEKEQDSSSSLAKDDDQQSTTVTNGGSSSYSGGQQLSNSTTTAHRRYNGSSSSSSLINGQPDYSSFLVDHQYESGHDDHEDDQSCFWGTDNDYFNLEPLPVLNSNTAANHISADISKSTTTTTGSSLRSVAKKSHSKAGQPSLYRFYLVRQRNYPPLYLENGGSRRRIYRTLVLGYPSSGKSSLLEQFSVWLAEAPASRSFHPAMAVDLAEPTNLLVHFLESDSFDKYLLQVPVIDYQPDAYLILFSVNNRDSFNSVKKTLVDLQRWDDVETKAVIIVANKSDLVRGRCVTRREGRELASANNCKYIEVSCTISHNIDVLLQGLGSQIVLKEEQQRKQKELEQAKMAKHQGHSPLKRRDSLLKRFLRKTAINKSKSCDNLHVL